MLCWGFLIAFWCAAPQPKPAEVPYCETAKPIAPSHSDTRATKEQIDRENAKLAGLCGPG